MLKRWSCHNWENGRHNAIASEPRWCYMLVYSENFTARDEAELRGQGRLYHLKCGTGELLWSSTWMVSLSYFQTFWLGLTEYSSVESCALISAACFPTICPLFHIFSHWCSEALEKASNAIVTLRGCREDVAGLKIRVRQGNQRSSWRSSRMLESNSGNEVGRDRFIVNGLIRPDHATESSYRPKLPVYPQRIFAPPVRNNDEEAMHKMIDVYLGRETLEGR